ncbi:hypothetical protein LX64_02920 [Chitinophaga skermanii]|uniref:Peptidase n=1 Tax=Chitinophaga skermanii TaxID=331697 RepID=A0A327QL30_9BACT|nr:M90 family metallopeptidase [Chitinophaga skermanii]RAJ04043.1 hypothetical protein LX64_02920 [Chitinophaga skermanii]
MIWLSISITLILVIVLASKKKKKEKAKLAVPADLKDLLQQNVRFYQLLDDNGKERFYARAVHFLEQVHIEGVGIEIENLDRALVAASAIIPIFGFDDWKYFNLTNVIIYPASFDEKYQFEGDDKRILGMVGSGNMNGQMILSQSALRQGFSAYADKQNTAIHEFVHLLDKSDGVVDGVPNNLLEHSYSLPWLNLIRQEITKIEKGRSDINPYGAMNTGEFLAVVSEYFFEKPAELEKKHPQLYDMLAHMFKQDLAKQQA